MRISDWSSDVCSLEEILTHREFDPDPANYELYKRYVYDIESNWKLWYDNAVECYHCPTIHSGTFNKAYETGHGKVDAIEVDGLLSQRFQPAKGAVSDNSYRSSNYRGLEMFPGFIFIQQDDIMMIAQMAPVGPEKRSEENTSELQSLMRISYAVFCLKKNKKYTHVQKTKKI